MASFKLGAYVGKVFDPALYDEDFEMQLIKNRMIIDEALRQLREIQQVLDELSNLKGGGARSDWANTTRGAIKCE